MAPLSHQHPSSQSRARALRLALLALASCAHLSPPAEDPATAHKGEALPPSCAPDECGVVLAHNAETEVCECTARHLDEALGARVDLVFTVPAAGGTPEVYVGRAVSAPEMLQRCLIASAATWPFPAPASKVPARFRTGIVFAPQDGGPCAPRPDAPLRLARIDKEQTRAALAAHRPDVQVCLEAAVGRVSPLTARVVVTLMVNRDGRAIAAQVDETTLPDAKVERCIVDKAYDWQLPKPHPSGVVTISYPFSFAPAE